MLHILMNFSFCLCLSKFYPESLAFVLQFLFADVFLKKTSCANNSAKFIFPSILSDLEPAELFDFELPFEDLFE